MPKCFSSILDVLDIPDHCSKKLLRGPDLDFWGEKFFRPRYPFVPTYFFVIRHILDILINLVSKLFFLKKGLDLELFSIKCFTRTVFRVFFISTDIQKQFSIPKFLAIRDVLNIEVFGAFCGL